MVGRHSKNGHGMRIAQSYAQRMAQLVTRVADTVIADIDELIAAGVVASRSEAVRLGLETLVDRHRRARTGCQIAEAYRRRPQTDEETARLDEATRLMVSEEPW